MKGIRGLLLAIGFAIAGALVNFVYLAQKSRDVERVAFIGIKPEVEIHPAEMLLDEHLTKVEIPASAVGNLKDFAYLYESRQTVVGERVPRAIPGGSLLLRHDLTTPPRGGLVLGEDARPGVEERAMGVPIDSRKIVPSLVNPGDLVSFLAPSGPAGPTLAVEPAKVEPGTPAPAVAPRATAGRSGSPGGVEMIGPFRILSIGNRLGSAEVMKASKAPLPQLQENVMMILVRVENGALEPEAVRLVKLLDESDSRPLAYLLHPRANQSKDAR